MCEVFGTHRDESSGNNRGAFRRLHAPYPANRPRGAKVVRILRGHDTGANEEFTRFVVIWSATRSETVDTEHVGCSEVFGTHREESSGNNRGAFRRLHCRQVCLGFGSLSSVRPLAVSAIVSVDVTVVLSAFKILQPEMRRMSASIRKALS